MSFADWIFVRTNSNGLIVLTASTERQKNKRFHVYKRKRLQKQKGAIFTLNGKPLKLVDELMYLGSNISSTESDVNIHLAKACNVIDRLSIFTNPSTRAGYDTMSIFKRCLTGLNSEFSFSLTSCLTKAEEPSLSYYLPIAGGRIIGIIPFPRVLMLCEMQLAWSRIWTCVAVSISYDDNHYTTGYQSYGKPDLSNKIKHDFSSCNWIHTTI